MCSLIYWLFSSDLTKFSDYLQSSTPAAMGQLWRGFDCKWYEMGVKGKVGAFSVFSGDGQKKAVKDGSSSNLRTRVSVFRNTHPHHFGDDWFWVRQGSIHVMCLEHEYISEIFLAAEFTWLCDCNSFVFISFTMNSLSRFLPVMLWFEIHGSCLLSI